MFAVLNWQDHAVIVGYVLSMIVMGAYLSRRQRSEEEYFLAGRRMPWFAVGISIIASLLSSLTYLAEPSEVWKSGGTNVFAKMLAIPLEMFVVWTFCVPFLMRFRFTSAYEYLGRRFGPAARLLGVTLFFCLVVAWMGFIVLVSSRALAAVSGVQLEVILVTIGVVATFYTVLGGLRAVIWTDVTQVAMLVGGAVLVIYFVSRDTGTGVVEWYGAVANSPDVQRLEWFSFDPFQRTTMITMAMSMFVWHVCTHTSNQMTVQRYFSTSDTVAARRSFVTGSLAGVVLNLLLLCVGLAVFYFYQHHPLPEGILKADQVYPTGKQANDIFPRFITEQMPPGVAGLILAAVLAAAMSSIDSGVNSLATVLTVESRNWQSEPQTDNVHGAKVLTIVLGAAVTAAAYGLDFLPSNDNIIAMMPRTFNCFLTPLAGMFFIGIFMPRAGSQAAICGALAGLVTSVGLAYSDVWGLVDASGRPLSFTLVLPTSLLVTLGVGLGFSNTNGGKRLAGLTWFTRDDTVDS